jgi:hypothetical protein
VLKAGFNRTRDVQVPPAIPLERLPVSASPLFEDGWITKLLQRQRNYRNDLDYVCPPIFPWEDGYNSNSYARGLLEAAGLPLPFFPTSNLSFGPERYPGWTKPIPKEKFQPSQP